MRHQSVEFNDMSYQIHALITALVRRGCMPRDPP